jgi:predicted ATPase
MRKLGIDDAVAVPLLAPLVDVQLDEQYETPHLSSARRRGRSIEILTEILLRLCSKGPTLLVFEDLHWADESTAELLEHVVATLPSVGLLGVLTARPDFDAGWGGGTRLQTIRLDRLNSFESEAIARSVARGKALP